MSIKYILYRTLMWIAHRFDWHYAPVFGPLQDGRYQRLCHWCGLRDSYLPRESITKDLNSRREEA